MSAAGSGMFGDYATTDVMTCRIAAGLGATKMIDDGQAGAAVIRCSDDLSATAVVDAKAVELSHGPPGTKNDVRVAPRIPRRSYRGRRPRRASAVALTDVDDQPP